MYIHASKEPGPEDVSYYRRITVLSFSTEISQSLVVVV